MKVAAVVNTARYLLPNNHGHATMMCGCYIVNSLYNKLLLSLYTTTLYVCAQCI